MLRPDVRGDSCCPARSPIVPAAAADQCVMFPLHARQRVSASSASLAEPTTAAGKLYAGATLMVAMGKASSVGRDSRSQSGRLLVSTTQSNWADHTALIPLSSPLVELSVTPVKVGT